jgi:hypothetical protein
MVSFEQLIGTPLQVVVVVDDDDVTTTTIIIIIIINGSIRFITKTVEIHHWTES